MKSEQPEVLCSHCGQPWVRRRWTEEDFQADLNDPEAIAALERSRADMLAGRVLPWKVVLMDLPRPIVWVLFHWIAPWTWGRKVRKLAARTANTQLDKQ